MGDVGGVVGDVGGVMEVVVGLVCGRIVVLEVVERVLLLWCKVRTYRSGCSSRFGGRPQD